MKNLVHKDGPNTTDQVQSLYVGYFGRAGDPAGANFWIGNLNNGVNTLQQEAASFATQPEAKAKYPYLANPLVTSPVEFVQQVYLNLFNRLPDAAGQAYWVAQLQAAGGNPNAVGQFILNVISGATGTDSATITNKVAVSRYFTETTANNGLTWNSTLQSASATNIANTTSDPASVVAANEATNAATAINVTVAQAALLGPTQPYNLVDTAANEANAASSILNKATGITTTDAANVAQATIIAAATNKGTTNIIALTDSAANISGTTNAVLSKVTGAATANTAATGAQASSIAAFTKAVVYSVNDTAANVAASTGLNKAVNITATGAATVAQATTISAATNSGTKSIASLSDTAANIAGSSNAVMNNVTGVATATDAATGAQATAIAALTKAVVYSVSDTVAGVAAAAGAGLNKAVNITATGTATVAQATTISAATNSGTKSIAALNDTAANIAASSNTVMNNVTGTVTAFDNATGAQATAIAAFTKPVVYSVTDTVANVVAAAGGGLNEAVNISAVGVATVAQATTISGATNSGTKAIESLSDTAAAIAGSSNAVLNLVATTATANTAATGAQASTIAAFTKAVVYSANDTAANLAASTGLNKAVNLTATGVATAAQANTIMGATNSGTTVLAQVTDTAANVGTLTIGANDTITALTVTDGTSVALATSIKGNAKILASTYSLSDTLANEAAASAAVLNGATNITATGSGTAAQAQVVMSATNSGTTTIAAVSDTAALINGLVFNLNDTITAATVTGTATVAQATTLKANAQILSSTYSLSDTTTAEAGASAAVLNGATNIAGTGVATVAEANTVMAATNSGTTTIANVTSTQAVAATLAIGANDTITALTITDGVTVAQATAWVNNAKVLATTAASMTDTSANIAASSNAVLNIVTGAVTASDTATAVQATAIGGFTKAVVYSISDFFTDIQSMNVTAAGQTGLSKATSVIANGNALNNVMDMGAIKVALTINGLGGNDTINGGQRSDRITAGTGNDAVALGVDGFTDTVVQAIGDSTVASATTLAAAIAAGQTITFAPGAVVSVDTVSGFLGGALAGGGDVMSINLAGRPLSGIGQDATALAAASQAYYLSGAWAAGTGVFTVAADGTGADTLIIQVSAGQSMNTATSTVVLIGTGSNTLVDANFTGAARTGLTAVLSGPNTTLTLDGVATGVVGVTAGAALAVTDGVTPITVTGGAYAAAALTTITAASVAQTTGLTMTLTGASLTSLASTIGSGGNDTFVFADGAVLGAAAGNTINGLGGTNTLTFTNLNATPAAALGAGGVGGTLVNISRVNLTNGTRNAADTTTQVLTLGAALAVVNDSATKAATVDLAAVGTTYTSASTGVDTVTLGAVTQSATTGAGNDVINLGVTGAYTGTLSMGDGAADTVNLTAGAGPRAYNLSGATLSGIETVVFSALASADTLTLSAANAAAISTAITFDATGTADTLVLGDGTYDFSAKTLTFGTAASVLDLDTLGTGNKTLTLDAADINNVGTITGEATVGAITTLNFTGTVTLGGLAVTNVDTVTIAGSAQTLTLDGNDFSATNYTTVTGIAGNDTLVLATDANANLINSTITGFTTLTSTALATDRTIEIRGGTIGGTVAWTAAGDSNLQIDAAATGSTTSNVSNLTLTGFDSLLLQRGGAAGNTHGVTTDSAFFNGSSIVTIDAVANVSTVDPTLQINMDTTTLNFGAVNIGAGGGGALDVDSTIVGTTGNDTITFALSKSAGSSMTVTGGTGTDTFQARENSGNTQAVGGALVIADAVSITDFTVGTDQLAVRSAFATGAAGVLSVASGAANIDNAKFFYFNNTAMNDFSSLAQLSAAVGAIAGDTAGDKAFFAVGNLTGSQVATYAFTSDGNGSITAADTISLVAVANVTGTWNVASMTLF